MKVETTAGQLRAGLRLFRGIIGSRNTIPVLGMVRLADGRLTGTDLDTELSVALPTIGAMEGQAAIDWRGLSALAGFVDADDQLTINEAEGLTTVAFNGSEYRMASLPASDFPEFPAIEGATTASGNLGLVAAMRRVCFAIHTEETRYYLNGVALVEKPATEDGSQSRAFVVATDGARLAMMPIGAMPAGAAGAIIPSEVVHWLCATKAEPERCVFSGMTAGEEGYRHPAASFEFAGMRLSAKLIDGTYPDIFRVIPRDPKPVFSADRRQMLRVLARMAAFTGKQFRAVKLIGSDVLVLSMNVDGNSASERLEIERAQDGGAPFEVGYNVSYLIDALGALTGERVTFAADDGPTSAPALITADGDDLRIVQMPMRV